MTENQLRIRIRTLLDDGVLYRHPWHIQAKAVPLDEPPLQCEICGQPGADTRWPDPRRSTTIPAHLTCARLWYEEARARDLNQRPPTV